MPKPADNANSDTTSGGFGAQLSGATSRAKERATDLGHAAAEKLDDQRDTAASGLETRPRRFTRTQTSCPAARP